MSLPQNPKIAVIGLGYVGLPLAVALSRHFAVVGFDIDQNRVAELEAGHDRTREVEEPVLRGADLRLSADAAALEGHDLFIVTVPTPVDAAKVPDLGAVIAASRTVAGALSPGNVVVYESTVYPGVTEDVCGPILEEVSGLVAGRDFFLGYSPERITPVDLVHSLEKIAKGAVSHDDYRGFTAADFRRLLADNGLLFDLRNQRAEAELPAGVRRISI